MASTTIYSVKAALLTKLQADATLSAIQTGVLSIDEVRAYEGLAALPDDQGTKHYVPLNLAPVDAEPDDSSE